MPIRLLMYMVEIWREKIKGLTKEEVKRKDFKLPSIVPIVTYNGKDKWTVPVQFKDKIIRHDLFDNKILNFEYILIDVNKFEKEFLIQKESITSAIFLLDQKVDYREFVKRLVTIVKAFDNLTPAERLELKNWLSRTLNDEIKDVAIDILDSDKKEVDKMTANITLTINELKEEALREGMVEGRQMGLEQGRIEGREQGREEGKMEGILEGRIGGEEKALLKIVRNMLKTGLDIEAISNMTAIDKNKIIDIKEQINL